ncbi:hypothetical protein LXL04_023601 [Taraxacum kok-saghyz]
MGEWSGYGGGVWGNQCGREPVWSNTEMGKNRSMWIEKQVINPCEPSSTPLKWGTRAMLWRQFYSANGFVSENRTTSNFFSKRWLVKPKKQLQQYESAPKNAAVEAPKTSKEANSHIGAKSSRTIKHRTKMLLTKCASQNSPLITKTI